MSFLVPVVVITLLLIIVTDGQQQRLALSNQHQSNAAGNPSIQRLRINKDSKSKDDFDVTRHREMQGSSTIDNPCSNPAMTSLFEFYFTLDESPQDIVYNLQCDDGVTYLQSPSFTQLDKGTSFLERACLPKKIVSGSSFPQVAVSCILTITDLIPTSKFLGSFVAYDDTQAVIAYNGNNDPPFQEFTVCVGRNCDNYDPKLPPLLEAENPDDDEWLSQEDLHPEFYQCQDLVLTLTFDATPQEQMYELVCDDKQIWYRPFGSYDQTVSYQTITEQVKCVERNSTCTFHIEDEQGDGMTKTSVGGNHGSFTLYYGITKIASYDGSKPGGFGEGGGVFRELSYCSGRRCKSNLASGNAPVNSGNPDFDNHFSNGNKDKEINSVNNGGDAAVVASPPPPPPAPVPAPTKKPVFVLPPIVSNVGTGQGAVNRPPPTPAPINFPTPAPIVPPTTPAPVSNPTVAPIVPPTTPAPVIPPTSPAPIVPPTSSAPISKPTPTPVSVQQVVKEPERTEITVSVPETKEKLTSIVVANPSPPSTSDCAIEVMLFIRVDEFPTDTSSKLICDGETLWDIPTGTYSPNEPFASYMESGCIKNPSFQCCRFTIGDSGQDGLTSPNKNIPGFFDLIVGTDIITSYDGSNPKAKFEELGLSFGRQC